MQPRFSDGQVAVVTTCYMTGLTTVNAYRILQVDPLRIQAYRLNGSYLPPGSGLYLPSELYPSETDWYTRTVETTDQWDEHGPFPTSKWAENLQYAGPSVNIPWEPGGPRMTGEQLDGICSRLKLSDAWLSSTLGVRRDTAYRWRHGVEPIPYRVPAEIAQALRDLSGEAAEIAAGLDAMAK